jgi:hypothetical protein
MVPCNSIGYFTLVLTALLPPVLLTFFTLEFFRFYLSAMPSLPPSYLISVGNNGADRFQFLLHP